MKILRPICAGVAGIFFPIGKLEDGGTCQYATYKCLKVCYALEKSYDETVNIPEKDKRKIRQFFIKKPALTVCNEVIKEMGELQARILSWFVSGDCVDEDVDRLFELMVLLNEEGVIQNGFTRNEKLYNRVVDADIIKAFVLTVESQNADDAPSRGEDYPRGIWAIPDYETGVVKLYVGKWGSRSVQGYCGFNEVTTKFKGKEIAIASNCLGCYNKEMGCFSKLPPSEERGE